MDEDELFSDESEIQPKHTILTLGEAPIPIHLHRSLGNSGRTAMARKIEEAGGDPTAPEDQARVIICRYDQPIFRQLEYKYDHDRFKWVEPPSWVDHCIMSGKYEHYLPSRAGKAKPTNTRTPFTLEDDEHLVKFLALRIPFKESGGRQGNGVYKDLCAHDRAARYPWAERHPWQAWRDRYTKNQEIFDRRIAHEVKWDPNPPKLGEKGQYVIPRKKRRPLPLRYSVQADSDELREEEEEEEEEEVTDEVIVTAKRTTNKRPRLQRNLPTDRLASEPQPPVSPPFKQPRMHINRSNAENDANIGTGRDKGKGRARRVSSEPESEQEQDVGLDMALSPMFDDNEPGPSQYFVEPARTNPPPPPRQLTPQAKPSISVPDALVTAPSSRLIASGTSGAPPLASSPKLPPDSQMTLVAPTQKVPNRSAAPPDAQATVDTSSPGRLVINPQPMPLLARVPPRQSSIARSTRSHRLPEAEFVQLGSGVPPSGAKRIRGRLKRVQPDDTVVQSSAMQPSVRRDLSQVVSTPDVAMAGASPRKVIKDEAIQARLHASESEEDNKEPRRNESNSSSSSGSEDDDEAARMLREANKKMVNLSTQAKPRHTKENIAVAVPNLTNPPYINIERLAAARPPRKQKNPQPSHMGVRTGTRQAPGTDPDATPTPRPFALKAAKKTAPRIPFTDSHDSDSDLQNETRSETTHSSFPVVTTIAHDYKLAQSPFTPARGTMAEERLRSERSKQGKRRGRGRA